MNMNTHIATNSVNDIAIVVRDYIVTNFLFGDDSGLDDEAGLIETGALDSTGVVELVSFLETHYSLTISDQDLVPENLDSISRIARFVSARLPVAQCNTGA